MDNVFTVEKMSDTNADILGLDKEGKICCIKDDVYAHTLKNKLIFGLPGSGKTSAITVNNIKQAINRGESIIVSHHNPDIYTDTVEIAKNKGYEIKEFDIRPTWTKNTFDIINCITEDDAYYVAKSIIKTEDDNAAGYWKNTEENLLSALILYVKETRQKFKDIYSLIANKSILELDALFDGDEVSKAAKTSYAAFRNTESKVQVQVLTALIFFLENYNNIPYTNLMNNDDIDMTDPMKKPCIYYMICSDIDERQMLLAAMFISLMIRRQYEYSDSLTPEDKAKQIYVNYMIDGMADIGKIYRLDSILSTTRARNISFTFSVIILEQLKSLYPYDYQTILALCPTQILLGRPGDSNTVEYFKKISGRETIDIDSDSLIAVLPDGESVIVHKYIG